MRGGARRHQINQKNTALRSHTERRFACSENAPLKVPFRPHKGGGFVAMDRKIRRSLAKDGRLRGEFPGLPIGGKLMLVPLCN
jgi:hypothetical protein